MSHPHEDELVFLYYGEPLPAEVAAHVDACAHCRERLRALREDLERVAAPVAPDRPPDYGAQVFARLETHLRSESPTAGVLRPFGARPWGKLSGLAALAAALVAAFLLGRRFPTPGEPLSPEVRERILLVAVGHHLERSQMILVELANAPSDAPLDVSTERISAGDLATANRLYRQTALRAGDSALASVLEELERVLVEVAAGPERLSPADLSELQRRIEGRGLLFKIRVVGSQVREKEKVKTPSADRVS